MRPRVLTKRCLLCFFAGNGLWHHHVLGRQQCGSAEGALCVPFDSRWQTGSAHQLYGGQSNVGLAGGLLHRRWVIWQSHTYMHAYIYVKLPANLLPFFIGLGPSFSTLFVSIIADEPINGRKRHWSVGASKRDGMERDGMEGVLMSWDFLCSMNTLSVCVRCAICWVSCNAFQTHLKYMSNLSALWQPSTRMSIQIRSPHSYIKQSQLPFVMQTQIIKMQWKHKTRKETQRAAGKIMLLKFQFHFKIFCNK